MKQRYQYRIYPTQQQIHDLSRLFGCCRVVYNDALALSRLAEKLPKNSDLQKTCITKGKKTEYREWLGEVSNIPLQQSVIDLGTAFKNYFDSLKGSRKGRKVVRLNLKSEKVSSLHGLERVVFRLKMEKFI